MFFIDLRSLNATSGDAKCQTLFLFPRSGFVQQSGQPDRGKLGGATREGHWRSQVTRGVVPH